LLAEGWIYTHHLSNSTYVLSVVILFLCNAIKPLALIRGDCRVFIPFGLNCLTVHCFGFQPEESRLFSTGRYSSSLLRGYDHVLRVWNIKIFIVD